MDRDHKMMTRCSHASAFVSIHLRPHLLLTRLHWLAAAAPPGSSSCDGTTQRALSLGLRGADLQRGHTYITRLPPQEAI
eukprot:6272280-Pyramimonas_sp.AAC.1